MNKVLKYGALAGFGMAMLPLAARAEEVMESTDTVSNVDVQALNSALQGAAASTTAASAGFLGLVGVWLVFALVVFVISIALFIFWIVMLIDVFKRTNWQDEGQKNLWMILMIGSIFVGLSGLVAVIYYFVIKKALDKGSKPASPAPQAPVQK